MCSKCDSLENRLLTCRVEQHMYFVCRHAGMAEHGATLTWMQGLQQHGCAYCRRLQLLVLAGQCLLCRCLAAGLCRRMSSPRQAPQIALRDTHTISQVSFGPPDR